VVPLYKRGEKDIVGNYRGIFLLFTAYKIYAEVMRNRLEEKAEEKNLVPENQAGFKKGRATIDNVFILNLNVQREKRQEGEDGKIYMMFVDLKVAFDKVKRKILWRELRRLRVSEKLVRRAEKIYEEMER